MSQKKWTPERKTHEREVRALRNIIQKYNTQIDELKAEREVFRTHFAERLKWWIECLGSSKQPVLTWLVENDVKVMQKVTRWIW